MRQLIVFYRNVYSYVTERANERQTRNNAIAANKRNAGSISVAMFRPDFNRVFNRQRINSALQSRNIGSLSRRRRNRETRSYYAERFYPFSFSSPSLLSSAKDFKRIDTDPRIKVIDELRNNLQNIRRCFHCLRNKYDNYLALRVTY